MSSPAHDPAVITPTPRQSPEKPTALRFSQLPSPAWQQMKAAPPGIIPAEPPISISRTPIPAVSAAHDSDKNQGGDQEVTLAHYLRIRSKA
jgi:hypothetical protein